MFNFGKYQNQRVIDVITKVDPNYYRWILEKDFSVQVKRTIKQIKETYEKQKNNKRQSQKDPQKINSSSSLN